MARPNVTRTDRDVLVELNNQSCHDGPSAFVYPIWKGLESPGSDDKTDLNVERMVTFAENFSGNIQVKILDKCQV